jgi:PAS domain S-box-containing protein
MTGYEEGELIGYPARKLYASQEEYDRVGEVKYGQIRKTGSGSVETQWQRKDGGVIEILLSSTPLDLADPGAGVTFTALDITERKRAEEALRENEARYRSLAEASQDMIFVIDREDRVVYINQQAADVLRKPVEAVINQPRSEFFPKDTSTRQYGALQHVFATGQPLRNEGPMTIGDGLRWFDHALVPILDSEGKVASVLGVSRDITKRVAAEQEQRQNERNNRFIAEHSVDIINRQTPECICTYASPSVTTLLGYTEQEVLGRSMLALVHPDDLPGVVKDLSAIRSSSQDTVTSTFRFRHKDGHFLWFESTTRIVRDGMGQIREFLSISRDITGRKPDQ